MARVKSSIVDAVVREALGSEDFVIVELVDGTARPVYDGDGELLKFRTGDDAAREAKKMSTPGRKFQPRRVKDDKWMERERSRFATKEYQHLPWADAVWWRNHSHIHGSHFPHVSQKNSVGLMAFTEDDVKGSADIQTAIKPGKYLERYFSSVLDPYIIRDLCTTFSNKFEDNCLIFGETEDEFEKLYTEGPSSCMSHGIDKYLSHIHPVRVYAAGDLKLAYMKRDGRIVARTLVFPERKVYSRIYGDAGRIEPLLKQAGFKKGPPTGAKIQRVLTWEKKSSKSGNRAFVLPHIDDISWVEDKGDCLVIGDPTKVKPSGAYAFAGANGLSEWVSLRCRCCDKEAPRTGMKEVVVDYDGTTQRYCAECVADHTKVGECTATGRKVVRAHLVEMHNGETWWTRHFESEGFICQGSNKRYPRAMRMHVLDGTKRRRSIPVSKEWYQSQGGVKCKTCGAPVMTECNSSCSSEYEAEKKVQEAQMVHMKKYANQGLAPGQACFTAGTAAGSTTSSLWVETPIRRR